MGGNENRPRMGALMNDLLRQCEAELPGIMAFWEHIVNIDSGSEDPQGLRRIAAVLEARLEELDFRLTRHPVKDMRGEYHIVGTREGTGKKSVLLLAHMDTVFAKGTAGERPFTVKGEWAYGPGVSDCKSGIALIIHLLKLLRPEDYKRISVLFNCDEELASRHSKDIVIAESTKHDYALSYEPGGPGDRIAIARKGSGRIRLTTHGKNSHAGTHPYAGVNALAELVWQVGRMLDLGDREKKTSVVFTRIAAGDKLNVIPDKGEAWADVRVALPEEFERLDRDVARLCAERLLPGSRVEAEVIRNRPPFPENPATDALAHKARAIYAELGKSLEGEAVGGVGDINYAYAAGAACLCRLAPPSSGPNHRPEEDSYIPAMVPRLYLSLRLIRELCG